MAEEHSKYSPSAASRWLACPASINLIEKLAEDGNTIKTESVYADQGTRIHKACQELDELGVITTELEAPWMEECVNDIMAQRSKLLPKGCYIRTEIRVDLEHLGYPEIFGTVDCLTEHRKTVYVIDYKTGAGVPVNADRNPQLMIYALGASHLYPKAETFKLVIIQPRIYKEPWYWSITKADLLKWFEEVLKPGIEAVNEGKQFNPSEDACRWCPASTLNKCSAIIDKMISLLPGESDKEVVPGDLDVSQIKRFLDNEAFILQTLKKIKAHAVQQAQAGVQIPGYKLVKSLGNRTWRDTRKADAYLMRKKLKEKERKVFKLISPTKAKKMLGERGMLNERTIKWLNANTIRPERGFIIVPESDTRPAVTFDLPSTDVEDLL